MQESGSENDSYNADNTQPLSHYNITFYDWGTFLPPQNQETVDYAQRLDREEFEDLLSFHLIVLISKCMDSTETLIMIA